jgi:hypothetical protein
VSGFEEVAWSRWEKHMMRKIDSRIQNQAPEQPAITLMPPQRRLRRRDGLREDSAPIWRLLWRCAEVNMAALAGLIFGLLLVGPVLGVLLEWLLPLGGMGEGFLLGIGIGALGTALAFALVVWFKGS